MLHERVEPAARALLDSFGTVEDPRWVYGRRYPLNEVLFVAVIGVHRGADGWVGVEIVCDGMLPWLRQFSSFTQGVPSHDTLGRVFKLLPPERLAEVLTEATERLFRAGQGRVAMDGEVSRRSFKDGDRNTAIHTVTAWASDMGLSLGQAPTDRKSNERTAILKRIELLDLSGCVVTRGAEQAAARCGTRELPQRVGLPAPGGGHLRAGPRGMPRGPASLAT